VTATRHQATGTQPRARGRLLVVSHSAVVPVNQSVYQALQELGWELTLVVPDRWRHQYSPGPVRPTPFPGLERALLPRRVILAGRPQRHLYLARLRSIVRQVAPQVAFVDEETFSLPALQWGLALRRAGVPFGVQANENLERPLPIVARIARTWVLRNATFVAARSPAAAKLTTRLGATGTVVLAPYAVPNWPVPEPVAHETFTIGFAGRLEPEKGLDDLVQAVRLLDRPAELFLVGDGSLRRRLEGADVGASLLTIWTGLSHERMAEAYARMDVLVLPSRTTSRWAEQFGRVLVEALWCMVPVVGSDSGEIPWVIRSTGGGRVVPEGDPAALAAALAELDDNPARRRELAAQGRAGAQRLFSLDAAARALDDTLIAASHPVANRPFGLH
jgi:glycosyltransferase involved in cell wall biosynthesis